VGGGRIQPRLNEGTIETGLIEFQLSDGHFRLVPHFYLNQQPPSMTIDPGLVLESVEISESMCAGWLRFVAPIAAEATRANGKFSLVLESTTVPLLSPADAKIRGELQIQQAVMGPGPLADSLVQAIAAVESMVRASSSVNASRPTPNQFKAITNLIGQAAGVPGLQTPPYPGNDAPPPYQLNIPEQYVPFRVEGRRVYHDQFHVVIGNVKLVTSGSVGMDQSLQLVAYVPILRQWVQDERMWKVIEGKALEIPIAGTIRSPRIDIQRVEHSIQRLVGELLLSPGGLNQLLRQ
jgi:hypothetical protein